RPRRFFTLAVVSAAQPPFLAVLGTPAVRRAGGDAFAFLRAAVAVELAGFGRLAVVVGGHHAQALLTQCAFAQLGTVDLRLAAIRVVATNQHHEHQQQGLSESSEAHLSCHAWSPAGVLPHYDYGG